MEDSLLILIVGQLLYLTYKVAKIESKLKTIEKVINNCVPRNQGG